MPGPSGNSVRQAARRDNRPLSRLLPTPERIGTEPFATIPADSGRRDMAVRRIVANIGTDRIKAAKASYGWILGSSWISGGSRHLPATRKPHRRSASRPRAGGISVPDISVEVDNIGEVHQRAVALECAEPGRLMAGGPIGCRKHDCGSTYSPRLRPRATPSNTEMARGVDRTRWTGRYAKRFCCLRNVFRNILLGSRR